MTRLTATVAVAALFVAGISIGALAMQIVGRPHREPEPWRPPRHEVGGPPPREEMLHHRLVERLGLDDEQRRRLDEVLEDSRRESDAIREELRPRVEAVMQQTRERIEQILSPEQLEEFERMHERLGPRHRRFFLGEPVPWGDGPPPPRARTSAGRGAGSDRRSAD